MEAITTFDQVPAALNYLINEVSSLKSTLAERDAHQPNADQWFNLNEFCQYHPSRPAPTTVYGWVSRRIVPHKRDGKRLFFLKSEIDAWLKSKDRKTTSDLDSAATQYILRGKKGGLHA